MLRDRDREEANALVQRGAREVAALPWDDLDAYGTRTERLRLASGRKLEMETSVFWDMGDWASDMCVSVEGRAEGRWRRRIYTGWAVKIANDPADSLGSALMRRQS